MSRLEEYTGATELTRIQGNWVENSSRWVDYIFGVDVVTQVVHAGLLPSTYSKTTRTSFYCNWYSCARQDGLSQRYRNPIYVGFGLVIGTFLVSIITIFAACRPFHKYWQINPDPGSKFAPLRPHPINRSLTIPLVDVCQAAISRPIIWASFASNVSTDIYLILIPIPMLWKSRLKLMKKIAATVVFGAGLFVLVCAILKSVFVLVVSRDVTFATPSRELTRIPAGPRRWRTAGRRMGK